MRSSIRRPIFWNSVRIRITTFRVAEDIGNREQQHNPNTKNFAFITTSLKNDELQSRIFIVVFKQIKFTCRVLTN